MGPMKLIVVDDETDIFKLYELFLKKEINEGKLELHAFDGGKSCLEYLMNNGETNENCIAFTDINMPEMDGYTLLSEIKSHWPGIDVFMVSAYSRDDYQTKAKDLGAEKLIPKPVDFQYLKEIIESYLNRNI